MRWEKFAGNREEWDSHIERYGGNYRQLYLWGERQRELGWEIHRYIRTSNNSCIQILLKKFLFMRFFYVPGGVSGNEGGFGDIKQLIRSLSGISLYYVRLDSSYEDDRKFDDLFEKNGWKRTSYTINSAKTIYIDLIKDLSDPLIDASKRWKKQLVKSRKKCTNLKIKRNHDVSKKDIFDASHKMQRFKKIFLRDDPSNTTRLIEIFGQKINLISCFDNKKNILGFRCALCIGERAWDFYAATTQKGRKLDIGYFLLYELISECKKKGAKKYILPISKTNKGDTEFKMRTGGKVYKTVGEWNYSNFFAFTYITNVIIYIILNSKIISFIRKKLNH